MTVMIGVDPHKATHTAVAIGDDERELATIKVRATRKQVPQLLAWAAPFESRTWAIESAAGMGYLLAQQLVDAGESVVAVSPTLASRVRLLGSGRSDKNDPNDALSVAVAALRAPTLRGSTPSITVRCCACWPSGTSTSAATAPESCAGSTPRSPGSPQAECLRNSTRLRLRPASTRSSP